MFRLDGKKAVVTGGGSGIGKAISKMLAAQGAVVHIIDLLAENSVQALEEIEKDGGKAAAHVCNVSNQQQVTEIFNSVGQINILVNNAGIAHIGNAENTSEEDFNKIFEVNVKGVYNCLKAAMPSLIASGSGSIVNVSSIAAHVGLTNRFAYSMSKGAVHAMTLSVARDYLQAGVRCNSISPARVHSPFVEGFIAKNYPGKETEMFQQLSASQPIGRMATVDEVAALVLYLSSDEAAFISGNDYPIDGGFIKLNN